MICWCFCFCFVFLRTLADQDEDGQFTFYEFTTAMHLIFVTKLGYILPMNLDPYSVLPPSVSIISLAF